MNSLERDEAVRIADVSQRAHAILTIVLPIGVAVWGIATPALWDPHWLVASLGWLFLTVVYVLVWWRSNPGEKSFLELLVERRRLEEEVAELKADLAKVGAGLEQIVLQSYASFSLRLMVTEYVRAGVATKEALHEALDEMLAPLYLDGASLGFDGSERWSISVYLYSTKSDELIPVWREKARSHPSTGLGRSWGRGEGHVGKAFVDNKPIYTSDVTGQDVAQFTVAPTGKQRPYDGDVYRSFASVPFGRTLDEKFPAGVLVASSERSGRFDETNTELMKHFADSIGSMMSLTKVDIDTISRQASSTERDERDA